MKKTQQGFTIIELMVGLSLGLLLAFAVAAIYLQTGQSRNTQTELSRFNDNGRYVLDTYKRIVTQSGYRAWSDAGSSKDNIQLNLAFPAAGDFLAGQTILEKDNELLVRFKGDASKNIIRCDKSDDADYPFLKDASVATTFALYLDSGSLICKIAGEDDSKQILVKNVVDYSLLYGEDTGGAKDQIPDAYVLAGAVGNWSDVYAVKLCFVLKSENAKLLEKPMDYMKCDGSVSDGSAAGRAGDLAMYRTFRSTIMLRNRFK
ncbi:PilW family protein [Chitinimonas taiwanensis]|uniref:Type IV Pilus-assembly protein W n=1 Tax=Chitinimonas taiwanensis DSM 18899 TaxID=1121279 RepID=A0A1K2HK34_9NEIS|nr:PilW family protein [Chitinimonas taiwanensis]SFZ77196.1 Type IV Pilus-assembly protein W [Chitinimonas taiwanensis DSM 18899]